jgi:hypothetical protein
MIFLLILSAVAAVTLIAAFVLNVTDADKETRKLYVIPGIVQLFAIFILLEQGRVLPPLLPSGIVFGVSCFFGLYLTYTAVIAFTAIGKRHRLTSGFLWAISALAFAITSYLG